MPLSNDGWTNEMPSAETLRIPIHARLVTESEVAALLERTRRVKEEYVPKRGGWVGEEHKQEEGT